MTNKRTSDGTEFLTVTEAAERLGQSRLRVREAAARGVLPSRRDNEGRLRVDIPQHPLDLSDADLAPDDVIGFLFDELEELESANAEKTAQVAQLTRLIEAQGDALNRAETALDDASAREDRLSDMLARALSHLEAEDERTKRAVDLSSRALDQLEDVGTRLELSLSQTARFEALLQRAMHVAETDNTPDMTPAADRAFELLDQALTRAETSQSQAERSANMLERALSSGEKLRHEIDEKDAAMARQEQTVEAALAVSERAVAAATTATAAPAPRKGFFRWLFGT